MIVSVTQPELNTASMTSNFQPGKATKGANFALPKHIIFFWPVNTNILSLKTETFGIRRLGVWGWKKLVPVKMFPDLGIRDPLGSKRVITNIYFRT